eukprot:snap_masked-scaffold_45-processed-gene-0.51-mRNA-1 protein AED:1.00 eAED:1.00 QI:0/0/0/0/1/1/2/0/143
MLKIFYFKRKCSRSIIKKNVQDLYFKTKRNGFKDLIFQNKIEKGFRILKPEIGLKRWLRIFQGSSFLLWDRVIMWLRTQFSSTWLGGRVQLIFQKKHLQDFIFSNKGSKTSRIYILKESAPEFYISKKVQEFKFNNLYLNTTN